MFKAVQAAAKGLGQAGVKTCGARDALTRLAGAASSYSHLLVDQDDADGLLEELADLATGSAASAISLLVLGAADRGDPRIRFIPTATCRSVRKALLARSARPDRPVMELAELRAALQGAMIETRYQPIVRVSDRHPVAVEALVRLNHPAKGMILPDDFVPQLERAGLAAELTRLVSARAFSDLSGRFLAGRDLRMSVNFSLDVLSLPSALTLLDEQRTEAGLVADRITIELTESQPVEDIALLRRSLDRLRSLGYGVAIDDVDPTVQRLSRLLDLPFTGLKLDKALVQRVGTSQEARSFLASTIDAAKARNLVVTAEGVETNSMWHDMAALGVDEMQGFLVARPLPVAAVPVWWDAWINPVAPAGNA